MNVREHVTEGITAKKFYEKEVSDSDSSEDSEVDIDENWDPWGDDE